MTTQEHRSDEQGGRHGTSQCAWAPAPTTGRARRTTRRPTGSAALGASLLAFATLLLASCAPADAPARDGVPGLASTTSAESVQEAYERVESALEGNEAVGIVARLDHQANAESAGLTLPPTRLLLFGNPALGTPVMQQNLRAGLDLPQKMLVYEDESGETVLAYNDPAYLAARHDVAGVETLATMRGALAGLAGQDGEAVALEVAGVEPGAGIVEVDSPNSVAETFGRLEAEIEGNENLRLVAVLDHEANAAAAGLSLPPARLVVFGNPALGTPLMSEGRTIAIDLPQKMLVYEGPDGATQIAFNDPAWLLARHGITDMDEQAATIRGALDALAGAAAGAGAR